VNEYLDGLIKEKSGYKFIISIFKNYSVNYTSGELSSGLTANSSDVASVTYSSQNSAYQSPIEGLSNACYVSPSVDLTSSFMSDSRSCYMENPTTSQFDSNIGQNSQTSNNTWYYNNNILSQNYYSNMGSTLNYDPIMMPSFFGDYSSQLNNNFEVASSTNSSLACTTPFINESL
jgi:hypothetical protein